MFLPGHRIASAVVVSLLALGAVAPRVSLAADPAQAPVAVRWWGQASVTIETWWGFTIAIDPFDAERTGYDDPNISANAVLVTHDHFDHNNVDTILGGPYVIRGLKDGKVTDIDLTLTRLANQRAIKLAKTNDVELSTPHSVRITTISSWHDSSEGSKRGANAMFLIETDGVRILHVGDLGQSSLTSEQLEAIGRIDMLLLPVGGKYTIDGEAAAHIVAQIAPRFVTPIHFRTPALKIQLDDDSSFFSTLDDEVQRVDAVGNTHMVSVPGEDEYAGVTAVSLKYTPWTPSQFIAEHLAKARAAREDLAQTVEQLSVNQLDHHPSNGTHTVRWNAEHTAGSEMIFISMVLHNGDELFPLIRISPTQSPDDYSPSNPDWSPGEEADHLRRVGAFVERFAYLVDGVDPEEERYPAFFKSLKGLFDLLENHYNHHHDQVKEKFNLDDWPSQ